MELLFMLLTVIGLCLFEIVSSIDNAVINAEVLSTMSAKARRWFLFWGLLSAVFIVRGLLPWLIVFFTAPQLGFLGSFTAAFTNSQGSHEIIEQSAPILLMGGGIFLVFLFFHWLFMEPKAYGLHHERFFHRHGVWFYAVVSILLSTVTWFALKVNPLIAFSAVIGSTVFFIVHGFKQNAEELEHRLMHEKKGLSDVSKIMYLEVIDATFSIDGVLGAFAFTFILPLILIGNGIGALVVRQLTISNIDRVKKYIYLKNGAMYSILFLGSFMVAESFGAHLPVWLSPVITVATLGFFFMKSWREVHKKQPAIKDIRYLD
ncbi:DUF475 domain-containing protein [Candidatus Woesearchaeota archaeon]|nr:DUF475 domain-containing protein [Candidatus Woesearchaeota archaeon]